MAYNYKDVFRAGFSVSANSLNLTLFNRTGTAVFPLNGGDWLSLVGSTEYSDFFWSGACSGPSTASPSTTRSDIMSGGYFIPYPGSSYSIRTTGFRLCKVTAISPDYRSIVTNPVTTPTSGTIGAGYYTITLPWTITYNGESKTSAVIGTDGVLSFNLITAAGNSWSLPDADKILVSASTSGIVSAVYTQTSGSAPNRRFIIRVVGNSGNGTVNSTTIVAGREIEYEWHFVENDITKIELHVDKNWRTTEITPNSFVKIWNKGPVITPVLGFTNTVAPTIGDNSSIFLKWRFVVERNQNNSPIGFPAKTIAPLGSTFDSSYSNTFSYGESGYLFDRILADEYSNQIQAAGTYYSFNWDPDQMNQYPIDYRKWERFIVPAGCTSVTIRAWGAGGGSGGSFFFAAGGSGGTPGNGGAGGYATTTLTVGTHIQVGDFLLCIPGIGGGEAMSIWDGGVGGMASAVYKIPKAKGTINFITSDFLWVRTLWNLVNVENCVLIAGGGGAGGGINWSIGTAGGGGSGGSANSGSGGVYGGSGTGATTTAHGSGEITPVSGSIIGVLGGGYFIYSAVLPRGWTGTFESGTITARVPEASYMALHSNSGVFITANGAGADSQTAYYIAPALGGGGAFQGTPGYYNLASNNQTANTQRGGGGGSNKVYLGSGSTQTSGISSTPPNSAQAGSYGYGGVGASSYYALDNSANRYYAGRKGAPGKIEIIFN